MCFSLSFCFLASTAPLLPPFTFTDNCIEKKMSNKTRLHVISPNVVRDKEFRKRLNLASTSADEAKEVIR